MATAGAPVTNFSPAPFACDYDKDGKRDLLVGDGANGYVYFYRNTNMDSTPILAPGTALRGGASPLLVGSPAAPGICDWGGDGLSDLLCGGGDGCVVFFKNTGAAQAPAYAAGRCLQAGGADLHLGIRSVVRVFDWDADGVNDLVGSSTDGVYWCKNVGGSSSPSLEARMALSAPVAGSGLLPINTGGRMRLDLVDWNSDGRIDRGRFTDAVGKGDWSCPRGDGGRKKEEWRMQKGMNDEETKEGLTTDGHRWTRISAGNWTEKLEASLPGEENMKTRRPTEQPGAPGEAKTATTRLL